MIKKLLLTLFFLATGYLLLHNITIYNPKNGFVLADITGGNRPSFITAAPPELAKDLYQKLAQKLSETGIGVQTGFFGEYMQIETILDGPVTIYLDSKKL